MDVRKILKDFNGIDCSVFVNNRLILRLKEDAVIREVWEETGLKISEPKLCGIKDWMKDEETRYIVLLYKTDKFEGIVTSSEEGDVFWLTLDEMKQRKLAYGMDKMLEVFLNDNISEYFFFEENGKWIEELK